MKHMSLTRPLAIVAIRYRACGISNVFMNILKLKVITLALAAGFVAGPADAATIVGNLGGLLTPTGAATNGNKDRQYSHTFTGTGDASGAIITFTYTLGTSNGDLSQAFSESNGEGLFRYAPGTNVNQNQSFTITIDLISINSGWTLNSVAKTDTVRVASEATKTTRFSVNGGSSFDFTPSGSGVAQRDFTDSRFTAFNSLGDTLSFLNVDQTANGGQNLRNLGFSFDVSVIPEPSAALLGGLGMLALLRRRRD
jgi:hypothetical protein